MNENGAVISKDGNRIVVTYKDDGKKSIPIETLEGITILGSVQMTTQCTEECLKRGIPVSYFSKGGRYFGRLHSTGHVKTELQRKQCALYDTDFSIGLSKRMISAKLHNQRILLQRYAKSRNINIDESDKLLRISEKKVEQTVTLAELMGHEGLGAKYYFEGLSKCIEKDFAFHGRNRRPPRDPFNAMISLGYSILMNEFYGEIEGRGLNPYFGFLHKDAEKHPTLTSDMMEEWRAVIVDATAMSMINGHEIFVDDFYTDIDQPGVFLTKNGLGKYLRKLEKKFQTKVKYLSYVDYPVSFRRGIALQIEQLIKAIELENPTVYEPIRIR